MRKRNSARRRAALWVGGFVAGSVMVMSGVATQPAFAGTVAPVTAADVAATNEDTAVSVKPLENDLNTAEPDSAISAEGIESTLCGDGTAPRQKAGMLVSSVTVASFVPPSTTGSGTIITTTPTTGIGNGCDQDEIVYDPPSNYSGVVTLNYIACDDDADDLPCAAAQTITITVNAVDEAPSAINDNAVGNEDTTISIDTNPGSGNDTFFDGETGADVVYIVASGPANGSLNAFYDTGDGYDDEIDYTPNPNFNGNDSFTYFICDIPGNNCSNTATVNITVNPVNDNPNAIDDIVATTPNSSINVLVLANDTDIDLSDVPPAADVLTVTGVGPVICGCGGFAIANVAPGNLSVDFQIGPGQPNGIYSFSYTISDGQGGTDSATVFVAVAQIPPIVINETASTEEDTPITVDVLANDLVGLSGPPGSGLLLTHITQGTNGNATANLNVVGDGEIYYIPDPQFNGHDSIAYMVCNDQTNACGAGLLQITVQSVNDVPDARDDFAVMDEDEPTAPVRLNVLNNDTDEDWGDDGSPPAQFIYVHRILNVSPAAAGNAEIVYYGEGQANWPNDIEFTPAADFNTDNDPAQDVIITYEICDSFDYPIAPPAQQTGDCDPGQGQRTPAQVRIRINPVNDEIIANNDFLFTPQDTALTIADITVAGSIFGNDVDVEDTPATFLLNGIVPGSGPDHGVLDIGPNYYQWKYTPTPGYTGGDSFEYEVCDTDGDCDTATVFISVGNSPQAPVAVDDIIEINEGDAWVDIDVIANDGDPDGDPLTVTALGGPPPIGSIQILANKVRFTPTTSNTNGIGGFTYTVSDGALTDTATVLVIIHAVNDAPVAVDDVAVTTEDTPHGVNPITNDTDVDADPLSLLAIASQPAHGIAQITGPNIITYTPAPNYFGPDSYTYTVSDGNGGTDTGTVFYTVTPVDDTPTAVNDFASTPEDTQVVISPLANDVSPDGLPTTLVSLGALPGGSTGFIFGNTVKWTPAANALGVYSFTYTMADPDGDTSVATIFIDVSPGSNDAPVAVDDVAVTAEDTAHGVNPITNDTDGDGDVLSLASIVSPPAHGTALITGPNVITYTPAPNYNGPDSYTYMVVDGQGGSDVGTVFYTVSPVDDTPVAADDFVATPEDTQVVISPLANDVSPDGLPTSLVSLGALPGGSTGFIFGDTVKWTPAANATGLYSFTYTMKDPDGDTSVATIYVDVSPAANDIPVANNDFVGTLEDTPHVFVGPASNDTDGDGDTLTVVGITTQPTHGTALITGPNSVTYTPDANYNGPDAYQYQISDGNGGSAWAWVNYVVLPVDDSPIAIDDYVATPEDTQVTITVLANDSSPDGPPLTLTSLGALPGGSTGFIFGNTVKWTPAANALGVYSFTYTVTDPDGDTDTATIFIDVTPGANDAPVAVDDVAVTAEDTAHGVNPITNDTDNDGDPLSLASIVTPPAHGTALITGPNVITYTPAPNYNGPDSYTYMVVDGQGGSDVGTVFYTVSPVDDAPVAADDFVSTPEDTQVIVSPLANDSSGDGLPISLVSLGALPGGSTGFIFGDTVKWTPAPNATGLYSFTYTMADPDGDTDTATIWIDVSPAGNDIPVANNDFRVISEDVADPFTGPASNDTDGDGDTLTVVAITSAPTHGTALITGPNTVTYTPAANYHGPDAYQYQVSDGNGGTATAWVNYVVLPVDDSPIAVDDFAATPEDTQVTITVLANDSSPDGPPLTLTSLGALPGGSTGFIFGDTVKWTPAPNATGVFAFTYTVTDPDGDTDTATITVDVTADNQAPIANDDIAVTIEDTPVVIDILANDVEPDGEALTVFPGVAGHGLVSWNGTDIDYTPFLNYSGPDSFTYAICDPSLACDSATVTITVWADNDDPVGNDDIASTTVLSAINIPVLLNDSDIDGGPLKVTSVSAATGGVATVAPGGGSVNYLAPATPGVYTFTYDITDGNGGTDTGIEVTVFVSLVNANAPIVLNDAWSTPEDTAVDIDVLVNDFDPTGAFGPLTINWVTQAAHGNVTVNDTVIPGKAHYIPDPQFNGHDYFSYTACNIINQCVVGQVVVTVESVNDVPVARDDLAIIPEDATTIDIDVLANDSDEDEGDGAAPNPAQYIYVHAITSAPLFGDAVIVGTGASSYVQYTPGPNFNGYDSFDYEICDSFDYPATPPAGSPGDCDTATVVINVKAINDPPLAVDDQLTVPEDGISALGFDPTLNDIDVEDGTPNLTQITQPSHGSAAVLPNGTVRYFPAPNWSGSDSFNYQACDSGGLCDWATIWVTVGPIKDAPVANNDVASTQEEAAPITIDVLANDYDMDNIPPSNAGLQVANLTQPAFVDANFDGQPDGGIAWIQGNKVMYMPSLQGIWTFTYDACDQTLLCTNAIVTVYVGRKNNPPVGLADVANTLEDTTVSISVLANDVDPDGDPLHIGFITAPGHGQVVVNGADIEYTPDLNWYGIDTFTYVACDFLGACSGAVLVQVTVGAVPDNPLAVDDLFITTEDTPIVLTVESNDSDADDQDIRICAITIPPALGIAVIVGSGANADTIRYTPGHGWNGHDQLAYQIGDGPCGLASTRFDTAVVDIVVLPVNQPPTAIDDIAATPVASPIDINVKANDFDGDNPPDPLTVKGVSADGVTFDLEIDTASGHGKVTVNPDNTIHFDPDYGFEGQDWFWYKVCDPYDACDIARVLVSVGHSAADANSISGFVYFDLNLNGDRDFGEPDVLGVKVQLWKAGTDGVFLTGDDVLVSEGTVASPYVFDHLAGDTTYLVRIDPTTLPPGFIYSEDPSGPLDGLAQIAMGFNTVYTNQDFGLVIGGELPETR